MTVKNAAPPATGKMSVSSITYSLSGYSNSDLNVTINVVSGAGTPQANAYVWAYLYHNGQVCMTPIGATNASGSVTFKLIRAAAGTYTDEAHAGDCDRPDLGRRNADQQFHEIVASSVRPAHTGSSRHGTECRGP